MENVNKTVVKEFILLAFYNFEKYQILLFTIILLAYIICVIGNIIIIILVKISHSLHTPMYLFISTFAVLEIMFVSVTVPKLLAILIVEDNIISFINCFIQLYALNALGETECFLLAVMAFDRNLAINNPLRYSAFMSKAFCIELAILPWILGFIIAFVPTIFTARLDFCGPNEVDHFFCDLTPMQNLDCSNPFISNMATLFAAIFTVILPFFVILCFYIHIIIAIFKINSAKGKQKAFSTCSSHLIVASLFYCSVIIVYVRPRGSHNDKFLALIYTVIIPLLNPFIYTLRNKNVKRAIRHVVRQLLSHYTS
ncbi:olfactory receptor 11L1-like [Discoglossus pictus]